MEYSLIDYNREVGSHEIVTQPDMRSGEGPGFSWNACAPSCLIEVSDCKMQEGSLRFDQCQPEDYR